MNRMIYGISVAILAGAGAVWGFRGTHTKLRFISGHSAVLVELFTSEGCSSCPPADRLLQQLVQEGNGRGEIVALEEHVDYWNNLGWKDPYSSRGFSERQGRYSQKLGVDGVYTPQMIVDGTAQFLGSDENQARSAITAALQGPKASIKLDYSGSVLSLNVSAAPIGSEIEYAVTEGGLSSSVARGENSGRVLAHTAVVRSLESLGSVKSGGDFSKQMHLVLNPIWNLDQVRLVVFIQEPGQGKVFGAAVVPIR